MLVQVALVSQSNSVSFDDVTRVSAALQKQVTRDFAPIWNVQATVDGFQQLSSVPVGYWPVVVRDDVVQKEQAAGVHLDSNNQPFALVQAGDQWPLTASHETMEMLGDPFGNRTIAGQAPKQAKGQSRVEYLVEVCDPSEEDQFGYTVNDIQLADFYTPHFFDPVKASGVRYSFTGAITAPRTILKGGYISWHNPVNDHWYQLVWFNTAKPAVRDLGVFSNQKKSLRETVDSMTMTPRMQRQKPSKKEAATAKMLAATGNAHSAEGRAKKLQAEIEALL